MITIYHNEACSKSTGACSLLQERKADVRIINYLDTPPSRKELTKLLELLEICPSQLIRRNEPVYAQLYEGRQMSEADYLQALLDHPVLMERPIVLKDGKALIARPPEKALELLGEQH